MILNNFFLIFNKQNIFDIKTEKIQNQIYCLYFVSNINYSIKNFLYLLSYDIYFVFYVI